MSTLRDEALKMHKENQGKLSSCIQKFHYTMQKI